MEITNRTTSLWKKRPLRNRFAWWLYTRWCNEIYIPEGKIHVKVKTPKPKSLNDKKATVILTIIPNIFTPGIHEIYIFDQLTKEGNEITIL